MAIPQRKAAQVSVLRHPRMQYPLPRPSCSVWTNFPPPELYCPGVGTSTKPTSPSGDVTWLGNLQGHRLVWEGGLGGVGVWSGAR